MLTQQAMFVALPQLEPPPNYCCGQSPLPNKSILLHPDPSSIKFFVRYCKMFSGRNAPNPYGPNTMRLQHLRDIFTGLKLETRQIAHAFSEDIKKSEHEQRRLYRSEIDAWRDLGPSYSTVVHRPAYAVARNAGTLPMIRPVVTAALFPPAVAAAAGAAIAAILGCVVGVAAVPLVKAVEWTRSNPSASTAEIIQIPTLLFAGAGCLVGGAVGALLSFAAFEVYQWSIFAAVYPLACIWATFAYVKANFSSTSKPGVVQNDASPMRLPEDILGQIATHLAESRWLTPPSPDLARMRLLNRSICTVVDSCMPVIRDPAISTDVRSFLIAQSAKKSAKSAKNQQLPNNLQVLLARIRILNLCDDTLPEENKTILALKDLPQVLGACANLRALSLPQSALFDLLGSTLSEDLRNNIVSLRLDDCRWQSVDLSTLPNLTHLSLNKVLADSNGVRVNPNVPERIKNLSLLDCRLGEHSTYPFALRRYKKITELHISDQGATSGRDPDPLLPLIAQMRNLRRLKTLEVRQSPISQQNADALLCTADLPSLQTVHLFRIDRQSLDKLDKRYNERRTPQDRVKISFHAAPKPAIW